MNWRRRSTIGTAITGVIAVAAAQPVLSQSGTPMLKGHNSNAPVDWTADRIEVQDNNNRVILSGDVVARQDEMTLTASRVTASYTRDSQNLRIMRIDATGGVTVRTSSQIANGNSAIYDLDRKLITMIGGVTLAQGGSNVSGGRLVIDLNADRAVMDGGMNGSPVRSSSGRVTGRFTVPQRN